MSPFSSLKQQIRKASRRARLRLAFGGFDISLNEHKDNAFEPHWQPQGWVFVPTKQIEKRDRKFRSRFRKRNSELSKPVMIKPWDGRNTCLAYALKGDFDRRVTLPAMKAGQARKVRQNVRHKGLRAHQRMELMKVLDRVGLEGRLCLVNAEILEKGGLMKIRSIPIRAK